ncbi:hypothetical protein SAMN03159423_4346 [Bradyrhizobium sp. NFR13]|nr:hypothetical protein SAMN03159423_4346 [Bradyrhizobium sp. NFR13]
MHIRLLSFLAIFLCLTGSAAFAAALPVDDPDRFANETFTLITQNKFHDAAHKLSETVGQPDTAKKLERGLKAFEGRKFDFGKKVYDKDYGGALRQIIHYAYFEKTGFIYFRFTYKMTSRGWYLTNFLFKDAGQDLFPKRFIEGPM